MGMRVAVALLSGVSLSFALFAGEAEPPRVRSAAEIRREIEVLETKLARLEVEARQAEQREDEARALAEIQAESRERLRAYEERLRDLAAAEPERAARRALHAAERAHIEALRTIDQKISALAGPGALAEARRLLERRELQEAGWSLYLGPKHERAAALEEMEAEARALGSQAALDLLAALRGLHEEDVAAGEKEFQIRAQRLEARVKIESLFQQLAQVLERVRAGH